VPDDYYKQFIDLANDMDCRVIVDTSGEHLSQAAEAGVYLLKPNMRELANLAGTSINSETQQIEAAHEIIKAGKAQVVVVSLDTGGALLLTRDDCKQLRTPTVPIRSKLGAGDSMVARIVLKLAQGKGLRTATLYGLAAGAATVMWEGTELCTKSDTDHLYETLIENGS